MPVKSSIFSLWYRKEDIITIKGLSIFNHINISAIYRGEIINLPINLDKEINLLRNSYTIKNSSGRTFQNLFHRFEALNKTFKSRFLDRFRYKSKVDNLLEMRKEILLETFKYLDFESLTKVLNSCSYLRKEFWCKNK